MDYKDETIELNIPKVVNVEDYEVGVLVARLIFIIKLSNYENKTTSNLLYN